MIHVYPSEEEHEHELEGTSCPCGPSVDWSEPEAIVTHERLHPHPDAIASGHSKAARVAALTKEARRKTRP